MLPQLNLAALKPAYCPSRGPALAHGCLDSSGCHRQEAPTSPTHYKICVPSSPGQAARTLTMQELEGTPGPHCWLLRAHTVG